MIPGPIVDTFAVLYAITSDPFAVFPLKISVPFPVRFAPVTSSCDPFRLNPDAPANVIVAFCRFTVLRIISVESCPKLTGAASVSDESVNGAPGTKASPVFPVEFSVPPVIDVPASPVAVMFPIVGFSVNVCPVLFHCPLSPSVPPVFTMFPMFAVENVPPSTSSPPFEIFIVPVLFHAPVMFTATFAVCARIVPASVVFPVLPVAGAPMSIENAELVGGSVPVAIVTPAPIVSVLAE